MIQEEKSLLLKDLCSRLPYGVKVRDELGRVNKLVIGNADLIRLYYNDFSIYGENALSLPYLRPMSSMTEEEKKELQEIAVALSYNKDDIMIGTQINSFRQLDGVLNLFNSHHLDWRGLIEKGLAVEAPDNMYKINNK